MTCQPEWRRRGRRVDAGALRPAPDSRERGHASCNGKPERIDDECVIRSPGLVLCHAGSFLLMLVLRPPPLCDELILKLRERPRPHSPQAVGRDVWSSDVRQTGALQHVS